MVEFQTPTAVVLAYMWRFGLVIHIYFTDFIDPILITLSDHGTKGNSWVACYIIQTYVVIKVPQMSR